MPRLGEPLRERGRPARFGRAGGTTALPEKSCLAAPRSCATMAAHRPPFLLPRPGAAMPSRWVCLSIVAFWLAPTGWLFWTDVLPELTPGQPPPFTIDLLDEVNQKYSEALWMVSINGKETHKAITRVRQHLAGSRVGWLQRPLAD